MDPSQPNTHLAIDRALCGEPLRLAPGEAEVRLQTRPDMAADERGLVHGGFVFGLADYAAMLAVNDPNVVLGAAEVRFTRPVTVGEAVVAVAAVETEQGKRREVDVKVVKGEVEVFSGRFTCFVLPRHVLAQEGA